MFLEDAALNQLLLVAAVSLFPIVIPGVNSRYRPRRLQDDSDSYELVTPCGPVSRI